MGVAASGLSNCFNFFYLKFLPLLSFAGLQLQKRKQQLQRFKAHSKRSGRSWGAWLRLRLRIQVSTQGVRQLFPGFLVANTIWQPPLRTQAKESEQF